MPVPFYEHYHEISGIVFLSMRVVKYGCNLMSGAVIQMIMTINEAVSGAVQ